VGRSSKGFSLACFAICDRHVSDISERVVTQAPWAKKIAGQCFHFMNTSNQGTGQVYSTQPQQGETCYSLQIQSSSPPPSPTPPVGTSICTYAPDYDCYQTGHPACCSENGGKDCPDYLTMCDNHAEGEGGFDYCTNAPDYDCYNTSDGQPSCCSEPGGSFMNCPQEQPGCDDDEGPSQYMNMNYLRSSR